MKFYQNDNDAKADFIAGKIGGFIDGPWQSGDLKASALGAKLAVAPGPTGPGGAFQPMAAPDGYYINAASTNTDLAKAVRAPGGQRPQRADLRSTRRATSRPTRP